MTERAYRLRLESIESQHDKAIEKAFARYRKAIERLEAIRKRTQTRKLKTKPKRRARQKKPISTVSMLSAMRLVLRDLPDVFTVEQVCKALTNSTIDITRPVKRRTVTMALCILEKKHRVTCVHRAGFPAKGSKNKYRAIWGMPSY